MLGRLRWRRYYGGVPLWLRIPFWVAVKLVALSILVVVILRWLPPPTSAFMLQYAWFGNVETTAVHYRWTPLGEISSSMPLAVMASEDQRFPIHNGFDLISIRYALADRLKGEPLRGASTISQQVAKNLFLWPGRNLIRKGIEAWFTVLIETLWPKHRIMEIYLNIAEFGRGVYGVEAASQDFFGKPASRITASEAALLAAVLPNPRHRKVQAPSGYVRSRQAWILRQMRQLRAVPEVQPVLRHAAAYR